MSISDLSIRNPVFAVMLSAALVVFGLLGYREMGISQFPEIDFPVVNITTYREAASPETMEFDVTDIVEDAVSSVEGIDYVQSQSLEGVSVVTVFFHLRRSVDVAMQDVQNAVAAAALRLPTDIDPPIVSKVNFNKFPVIWLSVFGNKSIFEINRLVEDHLKHEIETIPGCGGVFFGGLRRRSMRIWLDGPAMYSYGLDAFDVLTALRQEHVERPAGYLESARREQNVRVMGEARTADEFRRLPIHRVENQVIRLGDLAVIEDGMDDKRGLARFNRAPNVGIGVMRATGANVVQVCDEVKRRIPDLQKKLPPGLQIGVSTDFSLFIKDDIAEVKEALWLGVVLTAVVTFVFLGSLGTTLNVCISIPVSLIGTFMVMRWCGFTLNFMTLLALSLSVGVVVDDAILVLENIYRRREHGEGKRTAAIRGANEIAFAALAATLAIVAIFVPVAFMQGAIGRFFYEFAITVSVAVMLSLVVALSVTPMLCSLFLDVRQLRQPPPARFGGPMGWLPSALGWFRWVVDRWILEPVLIRPVNFLIHHATALYARTLRFSLRHPSWVLVASGLIAGSTLLFVLGIEIPLPAWAADRLGMPSLVIRPLGQELVPSEDQSRFVVTVICPVGSSIDYVDEMLDRCERELVEMKDPVTNRDLFSTMFAAVSIRPTQLINEGTMFVRLIPHAERTLSQAEVMNLVRQRLGKIPGMRAIALDLSTQGFTPTRGFPVHFAVQGPDWDQVIRLSERLRERMIDSGVVIDVNTDYRPGMQEVHIVPDRAKAAELGIPIERLGLAINVAIGGLRGGRFTDVDRRYDVRLRYLAPQRSVPDQLADTQVKTESGRLIPIREAATIRTQSTLPIINRHNHQRKIELTANPAPKVNQGEAVRACAQLAEAVREELGLPPSFRVVQLGNAQAMQKTLDDMWWALALGFIIAAMILGVQFNSFVHPFTVLMAVPFGVTGAVLTLWMCGNTLNLMSMIGVILLAGLVKKNSIVLVDYTNQLRYPPTQNAAVTRTPAMPLEEAVVTACPVRLRPIVMTTLATIAGALPLAFGTGPGSETRAPLARAIIGGIILSTLVTLYLVPLLYILFDRLGTWVQSASRPLPAAESPTPVLSPEPRRGVAATALVPIPTQSGGR
jgi:multidrug efflux pump subunit AcrB